MNGRATPLTEAERSELAGLIRAHRAARERWHNTERNLPDPHAVAGPAFLEIINRWQSLEGWVRDRGVVGTILCDGRCYVARGSYLTEVGPSDVIDLGGATS